MTDETPPQRREHRRRVRRWYEALLTDFPEGCTPLEAVMSIKALDAEGHVLLFNQKTDNLTTWEALGMLISASDDMRTSLNSYANEDDE